METFSVTSGKAAIGDPTMGLATIETGVGTFKLIEGALRSANPGEPIVDLDFPALFAVDAEFTDQFEAWYHRIGNETNYTLPLMIDRLDEANKEIGTSVAFYWEEEISGSPREGSYTIERSKIIRTEQADDAN